MKKMIWLWLPVLLLSGGCFWGNSYKSVADYDLTPVKCKFPAPVRFDIFRNLSGADRRFLYCRGNEVFCDEYNRWLSGPEIMLMRSLSAALPESGSDLAAARLGITVYRFIWNESNAELGVEINLLQVDGSNRVWNTLFTAPVADKTPAAKAAAMSSCVEKLTQDVASRLAGGKEKK